MTDLVCRTVKAHVQPQAACQNSFAFPCVRRAFKPTLPNLLTGVKHGSGSTPRTARRLIPSANLGMPLNFGRAPTAEAEGPSTSGRKIVFAVDGTVEAEEGLRWVVQQVARQGDTVHLVQVVCDSRTPSTAVGSSTAATQWSPARDEQVYAREFFLRLEHEAQNILATRFIPTMQFTGIKHEVDLLRMRLHKSAAAIGEAICNRAQDINADMVVIASHGAGVLAEYGSVARWCMDNSRVPVLLVPPPILQKTAATPSRSVIVSATDNLHGLRSCFDFALKHLVKPMDDVYVIHVKLPSSEEADIAARKQLVSDVFKWQSESTEPLAPSVNVAVELVTESNTNQSLDEQNAAGNDLCERAAGLNARAVVLHHHGKGMMREMMFSPVTVQVTKFCSRPLVVLGACNGSGSDSPSMDGM